MTLAQPQHACDRCRKEYQQVALSLHKSHDKGVMVAEYQREAGNTNSPLYLNASLSEQFNKLLSPFKKSATHMRQVTLLWFARNVLHRLGVKYGKHPHEVEIAFQQAEQIPRVPSCSGHARCQSATTFSLVMGYV